MANPKSPEARQAYIDKQPFEGMKIDDTSILDKLEGRHPCPKCGKSRKFFCYTCYSPLAELQGLLPVVRLPLKIDIIKHKSEIDGKSTAGHAAILAPNDVSIYTYPDIPSYEEENVVLIYPSQTARSIRAIIMNEDCDKGDLLDLGDPELPNGFHRGTLMKTVLKNSGNDFAFSGKCSTKLPITKAVFIDSTWSQSKGIYKDERIRRIPCVVIQNRISQFWRHQKGSPRWYLATIEAIHQFLVEVHLHCWGLNPAYSGIYNCFTEECIKEFGRFHSSDPNAYAGQYDNLLFFFRHMYDLIHAYYDHDNLHAYKRRLM